MDFIGSKSFSCACSSSGPSSDTSAIDDFTACGASSTCVAYCADSSRGPSSACAASCVGSSHDVSCIGTGGIQMRIPRWVRHRSDLLDFVFQLHRLYYCVLPGVVVREYNGGRPLPFFFLLPLVFVCMELEGSLDLAISKLLGVALG